MPYKRLVLLDYMNTKCHQCNGWLRMRGKVPQPLTTAYGGEYCSTGCAMSAIVDWENKNAKMKPESAKLQEEIQKAIDNNEVEWFINPDDLA